MWSGFDPQVRRDLARIKEMVVLRRQTPTHEWPLHFERAYNELLVIREWPDGSVTAYFTSEYSDILRGRDG